MQDLTLDEIRTSTTDNSKKVPWVLPNEECWAGLEKILLRCVETGQLITSQEDLAFEMVQ